MTHSVTDSDHNRPYSNQLTEHQVWELTLESTRQLAEQVLSEEEQVSIWRKLAACIKRLENDCDLAIQHQSRRGEQLKQQFVNVHEEQTKVTQQQRTAIARRDKLNDYLTRHKSELKSVLKRERALEREKKKKVKAASRLDASQLSKLVIPFAGIIYAIEECDNHERVKSTEKRYSEKQIRMLGKALKISKKMKETMSQMIDFQKQINSLNKQKKQLDVTIRENGRGFTASQNLLKELKELLDRYSWLDMDVDHLSMHNLSCLNSKMIENFRDEVATCYELRKEYLPQ